jgi:hypothetical protein
MEMHVVVTGEQKLDDRECWRLEFIPVHGPASPGGGYRVLLDKASGVLRQIAPRLTPTKVLPPLPPGIPFPHEPPEGIPWEVLPFVSAPPARPQRDGLQFGLSRRAEKGHIWWEGTILEDGAPVLVVKQKWADGGTWWSEYERWYEGHLELRGSLVPTGQAIKAIAEQPPLPTWAQIEPRLHSLEDVTLERRLRQMAQSGPRGQEMAVRGYLNYLERMKEKESPKEVEGTAVKNPAPAQQPPAPPQSAPTAGADAGFRGDPRLQARVNLNLHNPFVDDVLTPLSEATGIALAIQDGTVATDRPAFASLVVHGSPAWVVMLQLADSAAVRGRWEPSPEGYRLVGTCPPTARERAVPGWSTGQLLLAGNVLVALSLVGIASWRWWRERAQARQTP